ncbi:regulator of cell morphogenesis and NO signaling [Roseovarius sp. MBR-154]|jgi:regulator of cell morphogenesis and NO signaling|uniref:hemerythrin domain-containing protein n=1 Tax=Aquicoccus porphyridii TaxID=1852029 RepID=UPI00273D3A33|nr:hemerythrin domain-containing protein [Aquicoccus porphyridii]
MSDAAPTHDAADLTRHIETRHHARHRLQLSELVKLAEMVEDLHEPDRDVPEGLTSVLRRMRGNMEVHMKKEELLVFPLIRQGGGAVLAERITHMRADHDDHDCEIAKIRHLTDNLTLPEGACTPWATLYEGLAEFIADLSEHIRLENDVLFPQFEPESAAHV